MTIDFKNLLKQSLSDPRQAAAILLSYNLTLELVLYIFVASICLSTVMMFAMQFLLTQGQVSGVVIFNSPWIFATLVATMTMLLCVSLAWTGQKMSGTGDFKSIFTVIAWLQVLQLVFQAASYLLMLVTPILASLVQLFTFFWSLWLFVAFIDTAHQFNNIGKSVLVSLLGSSLGILVIVLLISLFGIM